MIHYYSAREIETMCKRPIGTIQRWASRDGWRRTEDGRRPVLYLAEDVERTMRRMCVIQDRSHSMTEKQQIIRGIADVLQRTYGDSTQTILDRKAAEAVFDYLLSTGAATASGVAMLIAAAGGKITIPDELLVNPPTTYWTSAERGRQRVLTVNMPE